MGSAGQSAAAAAAGAILRVTSRVSLAWAVRGSLLLAAEPFSV